MYRRASVLVLLAFVSGVVVMAGCGSGKMSAAGKIAVTTSSKEARAAYLQGRDLIERQRVQNSLEHFQKAAALDPGFALAELGIANAVPTAREAFEHMKKAVSLADKASKGERLLILATDAGLHGNAARQKQYLDELVAEAPRDERAQLNLGAYFYGQEDYEQAIACLKKATELAPDYSPSYNLLGYAYRESGRLPEAEQAFRKYIELIPDDPNPYDSDAELLLKMGRFDDAIATYRKALSFDSNFVSSHVGVAAAQLYKGQSADAMRGLEHLYGMARNDGERRNALFTMAVVEADGGRLAAALEQIAKEYAVAAQTSDIASMAGDQRTQGAILVELGKYAEAQAAFDRALKLIADSDLAADVKSNATLLRHFDGVKIGRAHV
jgi:tetratricopeptide (TPR) repeat protein